MRSREAQRISDNVIAAGEILLTLEEAAQRLKVGTRTLYAWMEAGELAYVQITSRTRRIPESALTQLITRHLVAS